MKRMSTLSTLCLLGLVALLSACSENSPTGPGHDATNSMTSTDNGIQITVSTPRATYQPGTPIPVTTRIRNDRSETARFDFSSTRQYDVRVEEDDETVWVWSSGRGFGRALTSFTLKPGESREWTVEWLQADDDGLAVEDGTYEIYGLVPAMYAAQRVTSEALEVTIR